MILKWFWHNPHLVLTSAALSWAGHAVAARLIVGEVSPLLLMQLRWFFYFLILLAIFRKEMAAHWPAMKQRWLYVALVGALRPAGFTSLFSLGASRMICFWSALTSYLGHVEVSLRQTAAAANNSGQACSMIVSAAFYKLSA